MIFSPFSSQAANLHASFGFEVERADRDAFAPALSATLSDGFPDPDGNGRAEMGTEITYTATMTNNGSTAAQNVNLEIPLDSNSTFVANSTVVARRTPPSVVSTNPANAATAVSRNSTIAVTFNQTVNAAANSFALECPVASARAFTVSGSGTSVVTLTPSQSLPAGANCQVRVIAARIQSTAWNDPMAADYVFSFTTAPASAVLRINEVAPNVALNRDLVELYVVQGGNTNNMTFLHDGTVLATFPSVQVATGDFIILHLAPATGSGDAPASETTGKTQYPSPTYSGNFNSAWDFNGGATAITYSSRVLRINDADGNTQDAVAFSRTTGTPPASYPALLQALQAEGLWLPANCGGALCTTASTPTSTQVSASWEGVTTTRATTAQRINQNDSNLAGDWMVTSATLGFTNTAQGFADEDTGSAKTSDENPAPAQLPAPFAINVGDVQPGETVIVTFRVTVNNGISGAVTQLSAQGTVTGNNIAALVTDDPQTAASNDATVTPLSIPTAASVVLAGRVLDADLRAVSKARVSLTDQSGNARSVLTNPFGFYRFADVPAGQSVVLNVEHKNRSFAPQIVSVNEENLTLDFIAAP